jgi:hypothetical protein
MRPRGFESLRHIVSSSVFNSLQLPNSWKFQAIKNSTKGGFAAPSVVPLKN